MIRSATPADAQAIADIYDYYIRETIITFEEQSVSGAEIAERIDKIVNGSLPWIVAEEEGEITGYAYAAPWRTRHAYRYSVETTIYLAKGVQRRGLGTRLYEELLAELSTRGFHLAIGGIALPNDASVHLHEKLGFKKVAHFEEVGFKFGRWIDVGYWQKALAA